MECQNIMKKQHICGARSISNFTEARDYVLSHRICDNSSHPGEVYNMTKGELKRRTPNKEDTSEFVVQVVKHKTSQRGS